MGPIPKSGILGAALSTIISYSIAGVGSFYYLQLRSSKYDLHGRHLIPNPAIMLSIYKTGLPSVIMNINFSLVLIVYNHVLGYYRTLAIASLGLCFRINQIVVMVLFGIGHGVMPTVGFNEGARLYRRLKETVKVGVKLSVIFSIAVFLIYELFAHYLLMLFTNYADLLVISVPAVRIFITMLLLIGPNLVWINMFIGLGKGLTSMSLLLTRDLILLIPMLFILPAWFGLNGVWMAQPLSNLFAYFIIFYWNSREFAIISKKI